MLPRSPAFLRTCLMCEHRFSLHTNTALWVRRGRGSTGGTPTGFDDGEFMTKYKDPYGVMTEQIIEETESIFQADKPEYLSDVVKENEKLRKKIMYKTLERKYFKPSPEVNLLTWSAKEQMRFLNREYPDVWTVEKLAESFPISQEGVIRLLKSKFAPRYMKELVRHDERVQKNWAALKLDGGPKVSWYQKLLSEGKEETLSNAAGISTLPKPESRIFLDPGQRQKRKEPGLYESIVKDYYADIGISQELDSSDAAKLQKNLANTNRELLGSVVTSEKNSRVSSVKTLAALPSKKQASAGMSTDYSKYFQFTDSNLQAQTNIPEKRTHTTGRSLLDVQRKSSHVISNSESVNIARANNTNPGPVENYRGSHISGNVSYSHRTMSNTNRFVHTEDDIQTIENHDKITEADDPRLPALPQRLHVAQQQHGTGKIFQQGKDVYDEDGEFLYRVP